MYDETLKLILSLDTAPRPSPRNRRLDALFATLRSDIGQLEASQIEDQLWAVWMEHSDPLAEEQLEAATKAIAARDLAEAESLLDDLVTRFPDYAEAWNKRATLYYLQKRDDESVADIRRTLSLEPRHFGAICGFGQICLRRGDHASALFAFDAALRINPHLGSIREAVAKLLAESDRTVH